MKNNEFMVTYVVEVEDEDSMEVGDYTIIDPAAQKYCDICEEAHPGSFLPLDADGVVIAPEPGVYSYLCVVDPDTEETTVVESRELTEGEVSAFYGLIDFLDADL